MQRETPFQKDVRLWNAERADEFVDILLGVSKQSLNIISDFQKTQSNYGCVFNEISLQRLLNSALLHNRCFSMVARCSYKIPERLIRATVVQHRYKYCTSTVYALRPLMHE